MSSAGTVGTTLEPPEPDLTQEEMIARAGALRPRLVAEQEATERRTYYSREMHEEFLAGRLLPPVRPAALRRLRV